MKECLWLPDNTSSYLKQKERINRLSTQMEFEDLKTTLATAPETLPKRRPLNKWRRFFAFVFSIPNFIPLWITKKVTSLFKDVVFISSMKYAMGVFFFPIWWFVSGLALAYAFGNPIMTWYLMICITTLFIRQRILLS